VLPLCYNPAAKKLLFSQTPSFSGPSLATIDQRTREMNPEMIKEAKSSLKTSDSLRKKVEHTAGFTQRELHSLGTITLELLIKALISNAYRWRNYAF
jgi:hypothetical protein